MSDYLTGPWQAVLVQDGYALDTDDIDVAFNGNPAEEYDISIRRGSALPDEEGDLPGTYRSGDIIELWDGIYLEDGDPSTDAPARWAQAQAMAAGLNAAAEAVSTR